MNIFFLHRDPRIAARYHCDKHVIKMIIESAQMLYCAHRLAEPNELLLRFGDMQFTCKILGPGNYEFT